MSTEVISWSNLETAAQWVLTSQKILTAFSKNPTEHLTGLSNPTTLRDPDKLGSKIINKMQFLI